MEAGKGVQERDVDGDLPLVSVRYALSSTPHSREVGDIVLRIRECFRFGQACRFTNLARSSREVGMNSSLSFHSQEQWHCWLPDPRAATATHVRKHFRPAGHTDATAQSGTGRHVTLHVPSSSAGATPADARAAIPAAPPCTPRLRPRGRRKPCAGDGGHGLPRRPPPHQLPLHAAVPAPVCMEARPPGTEAGKGGVCGDDLGGRGGDAGWAAGAAPQNVLPLCHHVRQPRGRVEGGGDDYCPLRIPAAWRALEIPLLREG